MKNIALEKMIEEQKGCKMFQFKVRIDNNGHRRTMLISANTELYAWRMAAEQLNPGDKIIWVK